MKKLFLLILVSVLIAGCINTSPTGEDTVNVNQKTDEGSLKDVLSVEQVNVVPSTIHPGELFQVIIKIKNNDEQHNINRVKVDLFDTSNFNLENSPPCYSDFCTIPPKGEKEVTFELTAPQAAFTQSTSYQGTVSYKISYAYLGLTTFEFPIVNYEEILRADRANKAISISPSKTIANGPVVVDADIADRNYALSAKSAVLELQLLNKGSGNVKRSVILPGAFRILFNRMSGINTVPPSEFDYSIFSESIYGGQTGSITGKLFEELGEHIEDIAQDALQEGFESIIGLATREAQELYEQLMSELQPYFESFSQLYEGVDRTQITKSPEVFECRNNACINEYFLPLYKKKSSPIYFKLENLPQVSVYKNYPIFISVFYEYELRGTRTITVKSYGG